MEITELLVKDHNEVDELFRRYHLAEKADTIKELTGQIVHDLSVHAAIEEQFVYPLLRVELREGDELADHAIEEHAEAKRILADIEKLEAGTPAHAEAMEQLIESVRHHVEDEEEDLLPRLREAASEQTRKIVGGIAEEAKSLVPTHPHPLVPGTASAQLAAGPWATAIDKVRDVLS